MTPGNSMTNTRLISENDMKKNFFSVKKLCTEKSIYHKIAAILKVYTESIKAVVIHQIIATKQGKEKK